MSGDQHSASVSVDIKLVDNASSDRPIWTVAAPDVAPKQAKTNEPVHFHLPTPSIYGEKDMSQNKK